MGKPILLYNIITSSVAKDITEKILSTPASEAIDIWINSPGGSLSAGWSILAALQGRSEVNMTVMGDASSMAFFMLLFATNVTAFDTSSSIVHRAAASDESELSEDELKDILSRNKVIREKMESRIDESKFIEVTGKTFDEVFDMNDRLDVPLSAEQAKDIGLVHKVVKLDTAKRHEIESHYYNQIAALVQPQPVNNNNSNINTNKMGKLTDLIFGEKDPILLASIGESQVAYGKIEVGAKVKAVGSGEHAPISGTFEAEEKTITVVENEITAITELDKKQEKIDSLEAKIEAIASSQITASDIKEVIAELQAQHSTEIAELKSVLDKAKLTASKPELPEGEFKGDDVVPVMEKDYRIKKSIEAKAAEKQRQRELKIKNGGI